MAARRDVADDPSGREVDVTDGSGFGNSTVVDTDGFGPRVAALAHLSLGSGRFGTPKNAHVRRHSVGRDRRGDRLDAEGNRSEERSSIGVDHGESVIRGKRQNREALTVRAGAARPRRCAGHVIAE